METETRRGFNVAAEPLLRKRNQISGLHGSSYLALFRGDPAAIEST
jgi:hypothetical protein